MIIHRYQKRVRYGETDKMGYLYYGNYAQYYEIGRVEMLRSLGLTYKEMEEDYGIWMPVVSMHTRFIRPALYDELLTIQTTLKKIPDKFISFEVEIFNEQEELVNSGTVRLCFWDAEKKETVEAPSILVQKLRPGFEKDKATGQEEISGEV